MNELDPLEDDILALVATAKRVPEIDPARKADIFAKAAAKIGTLPPDGGTDGGGGAGTGAGTGTGGGAGAAAGATGVGKLALAMMTFVVGIGVGIGVDRMLTKESATVPITAGPQSATVDANVVRAAEVQTVSPASLPDAPLPVATAMAPAHASASGEAPSSRGLAAERGLLDVARSALARGEPTEALVATTRHAREYPDGTLVEEREAIAIKALVALGRRDEARTRLHGLEQRFPNGLTVRAVKAAVEGPP